MSQLTTETYQFVLLYGHNIENGSLFAVNRPVQIDVSVSVGSSTFKYWQLRSKESPYVRIHPFSPACVEINQELGLNIFGSANADGTGFDVFHIAFGGTNEAYSEVRTYPSNNRSSGVVFPALAIGCSLGLRDDHFTMYSAHRNGERHFFYTTNQNTSQSDSFKLGIDICKQGRSGPDCRLNCPRSFFICRLSFLSRHYRLPNPKLRL